MKKAQFTPLLVHRSLQMSPPSSDRRGSSRAAELRHGLASRTLQAPPRACLAPPRSLEAPIAPCRGPTTGRMLAVESDAILRRPSAATQNASGVCVVGWRGILIPKCTVPNLFWVCVRIWVCCWSQPKNVVMSFCAVFYIFYILLLLLLLLLL